MKKRVLYILYANPASYPPLEHSARILADDEWTVHILGIAVAGQESIVIAEYKGIKTTILSACSPGWRQKLHYLRFVLCACWLALRLNCLWIYASDLLSTPTALVLKGVLRRKVVYHEHDSPSHNSKSFFVRICMFCRMWLAKKANCIVIPNIARSQQFALENNVSEKNIHCVWNCPARSEAEIYGGKKSDDFWIIYHGSIVPDRLPLDFFDALTLVPDRIKLRIIGYETVGSIGYIGKMQDRANKLGVSHRVKFLGALPRQNVLDWCRESNVGLAFMPINCVDINMVHMVGASNKPFDNLAAGIPLLVSDLPEWREMFVEPGYAKVCNPNDPANIAEALLQLFQNPQITQESGQLGRKKIIADWNYEHQFLPVLRLLNSSSDNRI